MNDLIHGKEFVYDKRLKCVNYNVGKRELQRSEES